jgi:hypothetical protein
LGATIVSSRLVGGSPNKDPQTFYVKPLFHEDLRPYKLRAQTT